MLVFEVFRGEGKPEYPEKTSRCRVENQQIKLNPHMTPSPGIEPGPHWWKASALTTAPSLHPTFNARGLGDKLKREEIFYWLKHKNMSIYFIQEAHCTEDNMHDWRAEWGYHALFSCCSSTKAGVAILFNNNFSFQVTRTYSDPKGRFIISDVVQMENV